MNNSQTIAEGFRRYKLKVEQGLSQLPAIIGNEAVNYSLEAFEKQGWEGKQWDKRKSKKDAGRPLLIGPRGAARLKRSVRVISLTANRVKWGTDVPYARIHNEGGLISRAAHSESFTRNRYTRGKKKGRFQSGTTAGQGFNIPAYSITMPRRQFVGINNELRARFRRVGVEHMQRAIR